MKDEKIIMYDSPEAAEQTTLTGWKSKGKDGQFWYKDEHMARWAGCTHLKCDCGEVMDKSYTKCISCRRKASNEWYAKLPYKEWDGKEYIAERDGDKFFWDLDSLEEYMHENDMEEIELLICQPMGYQMIDTETVAGDAYEDWEPSVALEEKIKEFNDFLSTLPPHSWEPGKIRTSHKIEREEPTDQQIENMNTQ